jgi:hypothetical protein
VSFSPLARLAGIFLLTRGTNLTVTLGLLIIVAAVIALGRGPG